MIQRPRLKKYLTVFPIAGRTWGIRGGSDELWRITLADERAVRTFSTVLPWLDGAHDVDGILAGVNGQGVDANAALELLGRLEHASLIEESTPSALSPDDESRFEHQIAFFSRFGRPGGDVQGTLRASTAAVAGSGRFARVVRRQLEEAGFGTVVALRDDAADGALPLDRETIWPAGGPAALPRVLLVPQEAHDPPLLEAVDRFSKRHGVPWMLLRATDPLEGWVGPLFVPGETACYVSFDARLRANVPYYAEYRAFTEHLRERGGAPTVGTLHAHHEMLAAVAVAEVVALVTGIAVPQLAGRLLTVNFSTWEMETHDVLRLPGVDLDAASFPAPFTWKVPIFRDAESDDDILTRRA